MNRYLLYISYLGTPFRGMQRQNWGINPRPDDPLTVQGQIEMALKRLGSENEPCIVTSSRTDAGVHAFSSTCHVDLKRPCGEPYSLTGITLSLNGFFNKTQVPIRVIRTYLVPDTFHSRHHACSRTYLYRLCAITGKDNESPPFHIPIEEDRRCLFQRLDNFDIDRMRQAAKMFLGHHDFRTFMGKGPKDPDKITRRIIERIEIVDSKPNLYSSYSWPACMGWGAENYKFYDIFVKSSGFLYNQVRRTVGCLIAAAQGKVNFKDIQYMLEVPSHQSWDPKVKTVPAHGLYLCEVDYSQAVRQTFRDTVFEDQDGRV